MGFHWQNRLRKFWFMNDHTWKYDSKDNSTESVDGTSTLFLMFPQWSFDICSQFFSVTLTGNKVALWWGVVDKVILV